MRQFLKQETFLGDADCAEDGKSSAQVKAAELHKKQVAINECTNELAKITLHIESAYLLLDLEQSEKAHTLTRPLLDRCIELKQWQLAAETCDVLFQADQKDAVKALMHGIWLGVTYPIATDLSIALLQHFIDETPDRSDGAAVAAATACYLADVRSTPEEKESLVFFTHQLLGRVARSHSQVEEPDIFDFWVEQLELNEPDKFLPRLAKSLDVVVDGDWWFDRDALRAAIQD